jgi:hypothetical protein
VGAHPRARRRYGGTTFGPVSAWRDDTGAHALAADGRRVHVALPATHRQPDGARMLREGVAVSVDGRHIATLTQEEHGVSRASRRVHVRDAGDGVVPDGAYLRRRRFSAVWLQTDDEVLVRSAGAWVFSFRALFVAPGVSDDLALAYTVLREAVGFAV